ADALTISGQIRANRGNLRVKRAQRIDAVAWLAVFEIACNLWVELGKVDDWRGCLSDGRRSERRLHLNRLVDCQRPGQISQSTDCDNHPGNQDEQHKSAFDEACDVSPHTGNSTSACHKQTEQVFSARRQLIVNFVAV